jgi:hypothetical protein
MEGGAEGICAADQCEVRDMQRRYEDRSKNRTGPEDLSNTVPDQNVSITRCTAVSPTPGGSTAFREQATIFRPFCAPGRSTVPRFDRGRLFALEEVFEDNSMTAVRNVR